MGEDRGLPIVDRAEAKRRAMGDNNGVGRVHPAAEVVFQQAEDGVARTGGAGSGQNERPAAAADDVAVYPQVFLVEIDLQLCMAAGPADDDLIAPDGFTVVPDRIIGARDPLQIEAKRLGRLPLDGPGIARDHDRIACGTVRSEIDLLRGAGGKQEKKQADREEAELPGHGWILVLSCPCRGTLARICTRASSSA